MRITWKDTTRNDTPYTSYNYRKHKIERYQGGWTISLPDDNNIYRTIGSAKNAIDKVLGGTGQKGKADDRRIADGIEILGQKSG